MNIRTMPLVVCLCWVSITGVAQDSYSEAYRKALREGARVKITVSASAPGIGPVSNATVNVFFEQRDGNQYKEEGKTDALGRCTVEGTTRSSIGGSVVKGGFYQSVFHLPFATGQERIDNGRWLPWNPTIPVVLREVRDPIPMYVKSIYAILPKGVFVGFDCLVGEFLPPVGKGEIADFNVLVEQDGVLTKDRKYRKRMVLRAASEDGGFVFMASHLGSAFKSEYQAPLDEYSATVDFYEEYPPESAGKPKVAPFDSNKHMVFRSRVKKDDKGNVVEAFHGKVYGTMEYGRNARSKTDAESMVKFLYYFNPTPNDRNIEFDGRNNLFKPNWRSKLNWSREP